MGEQVKVNTICHECGGDGIVMVARAAIAHADDKVIHTAAERQRCKLCGGSGKLAGIVAPM